MSAPGASLMRNPFLTNTLHRCRGRARGRSVVPAGWSPACRPCARCARSGDPGQPGTGLPAGGVPRCDGRGAGSIRPRRSRRAPCHRSTEAGAWEFASTPCCRRTKLEGSGAQRQAHTADRPPPRYCREDA
jgi:hypothetical protein